MAEAKKPGAEQPQQPAGIQVISQYTKDLSFENPNAPESLIGGWGQPETTVQVSLRHQKVKDDTFECTLNLRVEAKKKDSDKIAFIADLAYAALVILRNIPKENLQPVLMVEVPKLLFPFAREVIAGAVSKGGYPPLYLTPINFEAFYVAEMQRLKQEQEEQGKSTAKKK